MKHVRNETYLSQLWYENIFCQSLLHKMGLFNSILNRTIWICHSIELAQSCRVLPSTLKLASIEVLLHNDVNAVEIVPSEVASSK